MVQIKIVVFFLVLYVYIKNARISILILSGDELDIFEHFLGA